MQAGASMLCAALLALGMASCQREREQLDTETPASTADTTTPTTPADTTYSDTADSTRTPNTTAGSDVTSEAPMDESNPTINSVAPPPVTDETPTDGTDLSERSGVTSTEPPPDESDMDEAQTPEQR